eukprot:6205377-Pleurochrysis_carterae.AAC.4
MMIGRRAGDMHAPRFRLRQARVRAAPDLCPRARRKAVSLRARPPSNSALTRDEGRGNFMH